MGIDVIFQMIGSYAFPIVACIAMGLYVKECNKENKDMFNKERDAHKEEVRQITDAINNNTLVMQRLLDKLD